MEGAAVALLALERELVERPTAFGFFQAVQLLEQLRPEREAVGRFVDPAREVVRFTVHRSLAFPASEIQDLALPAEGPARMRVNFMGLTGPQGVLPHHYTQLGGDPRRRSTAESAYADFLDLFHHRIISLFYRAWQKTRAVASIGTADDALRRHVLALAGMDMPEQRRELPFDDDALVFYSGLLSTQQRSAVALEQLLEDFFDAPVQVRCFEGGWFPLSPADQCELGADVEDASCALGGGAVVGDEIWDPQSRVRLRVGPLTLGQYRRFLPDGDAHEQLRALARYFGNDEYEFDLQPVLAADEVPGLRLGADELPLGWSTWINSARYPADADETILTL